jgi:hypothetical protein
MTLLMVNGMGIYTVMEALRKLPKGNLFKGPFHLPRQEWYCYKILNEF